MVNRTIFFLGGRGIPFHNSEKNAEFSGYSKSCIKATHESLADGLYIEGLVEI